MIFFFIEKRLVKNFAIPFGPFRFRDAKGVACNRPSRREDTL
jgi:hypothetical protein